MPRPSRSFLSPEDQVAHWQRWKDGDAKAGHAIFNSYENYIKKFLRKTYGRRVAGENFYDALSAATIGFYKAMERFDPAQNVLIGTYAVFWMRAEVDEELRKIYDGVNRNAKAITIHKVVSHELDRTSRQDVSLSEAFGHAAKKLGLKPESVRASFQKSTRQKVSLETRVAGPESDMTLADVIPDNSADPAERLDEQYRASAVHAAVSQLNPRLQKVIALRFGLAVGNGYDNDSETLDTISKELGVSRERVRQLEVVAKNKLRKIMTGMKLSDAI